MQPISIRSSNLRRPSTGTGWTLSWSALRRRPTSDSLSWHHSAPLHCNRPFSRSLPRGDSGSPYQLAASPSIELDVYPAYENYPRTFCEFCEEVYVQHSLRLFEVANHFECYWRHFARLDKHWGAMIRRLRTGQNSYSKTDRIASPNTVEYEAVDLSNSSLRWFYVMPKSAALPLTSCSHECTKWIDLLFAPWGSSWTSWQSLFAPAWYQAYLGPDYSLMRLATFCLWQDILNYYK